MDSPVLYAGLRGGSGEYGSSWYENEIRKTNDKVIPIIRNEQDHGSTVLDCAIPPKCGK